MTAERLERSGGFAPHGVGRAAQPPIAGRRHAPGILLPQSDEPIRSRIGQRTQQHAVNDREHCRRRADAEGERDDGGRRKARRAAHGDEGGPKCEGERPFAISLERFFTCSLRHCGHLSYEPGCQATARQLTANRKVIKRGYLCGMLPALALPRHPNRPLRGRVAARQRRHGRGLSRPRHSAAPRGRAQAAAGISQRRSRAAGAFQPRGAAPRIAQPSTHRRDLWRRGTTGTRRKWAHRRRAIGRRPD